MYIQYSKLFVGLIAFYLNLQTMAKKKIHFDLFQIECKNTDLESIGFETVLLDILDDYVSPTFKGNPIIVIEEPKTIGNFIFGTMANNQMYDLPSSYDNQTKTVEQLAINPTAGLAHYTSFLFDKELQILAFEVKQTGVSFAYFCDFFEKNYNLPPINASIVIDPAELKKLNSFDVIKKFSVKVSRLQNGTLFSTKNPELQKLIGIADDTNSGTIEYTLTSQRKKDESLTLGYIKKAVQELLKFKKTEEVKVLKVTGKETEDEQAEIINFISNKYRLTIETETKRYNSSFLLNEKYSAVKIEYVKVRQELRKAYKKTEENA